MAIANYTAVSTRKELAAKVDRHRKKLGMTKYPVWFRGHSKVHYNLLPGLFRQGEVAWQVEHNLYAGFISKAKRFLPKDASSWEHLSTMQHWGAPTRALDWTTSLNTALFFCVYGDTDRPVLWMMNPYEVNGKSTGRRVIFDELDKAPYEYIDSLGGKGVPHEGPMALSVAWMNERIERQAGLFTIHGRDQTALNEMPAIRSSIRHIVIDETLVASLRRDLIEQGVTPFAMYPDLGGVCSTLKWQHGF